MEDFFDAGKLVELEDLAVFLFSSSDGCFVPYFHRFDLKTFFPPFNYDIAYNEGNYHSTMEHLPELFDTYDGLSDRLSKESFLAVIKTRLTGDFDDFLFAKEPQYFLDGFFPEQGDIAIDGGAYDGTTAESFVAKGAEVYSFEMDADNYEVCKQRAERVGFTAENLGLSDSKSIGYYLGARGAGSARVDNPDSTQGAREGNFISIDTYVREKFLLWVDYIKLDIEGAELDCLRGARRTIARCKPKMALSAYHKSEDLWTLYAYVKSLRPDYEFAFRHYRVDCTDYLLSDRERAILDRYGLGYFLPSYWEYVLYCR